MLRRNILKIFFITFIVILFFQIISSYYLKNSLLHDIIENQQKNRTNLTAQIVTNLRNDIITANFRTLKHKIKQATKKSNISKITILKDNIIIWKLNIDSKHMIETTPISNILYFDSKNQIPYCTITFYFLNNNFEKAINRFYFKIILATILQMIFIIFVAIIFANRFIKTYKNFQNWMLKIIKNPDNAKEIDNTDDEILNDLLYFSRELQEKNKLLEAETKKAAIGKIARQVAHDIRSPLTSLSSAVKRVSKSLAEDDRIIIRTQIQRIKDIANNLLAKNKERPKETDTSTPQLLYTVIEEIITEKRLYFRDKLGINIEANIDNTYGLFAKINTSQLKRVISNLINNSIEAYPSNEGNVFIHLFESDGQAKIIVEDLGVGIPKSILSKLGKEGASFGKNNSKESGSGIGLHHAIQTIESFGGKLEIDSIEGKGTKIILFLPLFEPPHWFVPNLKIKNNQKIVILDDDAGIHSIWDNRFKENELSNLNIELIHLSNPKDFSEYIDKNICNNENTIFLCDLELIGHKENGLDLIEKHKLNTAILVTSHYDERSVRERCKKLNVKLIPKMLANLVPFTIIEATSIQKENKSVMFDAVFIDDDKYIRMDWERYAEENDINLLTLPSTKDFIQYKDTISEEKTEIYIDRELGENEPKGEDFALELSEYGFKNLYMATGHSPDIFKNLSYLKGVIGKEPFGIEDINW